MAEAHTHASIDRLLQIFETFLKIDSGFPMHYALCLLHIAKAPGLSITDLSKITGIQISTISRIVGALSEWRDNGQPYGLIEIRQSPIERRRKELHLSKNGEKLIQKLKDKLK